VVEREPSQPDFAAELRRQQFSSLLKLSPQAIVVLDTDGRIREWNPAAVELLGWARGDVLGLPLHGLAPAAYRTELERLWGELEATGQAGVARSSHLHRDGTRFPVEVYMAPIQDMDGSFAGVVATLSRQADLPEATPDGRTALDAAPVVHEQKRPSSAPRLSALELDEVTSLPGRRWLQQRLIAPLAPGEERAVAVLDVDAFALVNQGYGPEAGDAVLRELASRLARVAGAATVGRWQADEFVCILDGPDASRELDALVARMAPAAREPFELADDRVRLTVSVGLACSTDVRLPMLFRSGSAAMAAAKARGRDCAVWFDDATTPEVGLSGLRMAHDLHRGLVQGEMRLHFQPVVELATNDIDGVEALVRWERPGVGLLLPEAFMEIAERTGQIVALGGWVIGQACRAAVDFEAAGLAPVRVSINVSARQLSDPGLVGMLDEALTRTGCPPERIAIEVTETAVLHDIGAATAILETIKSLGVELDLDDFGTGYSSLLYLRHFPVDRIKIDRSFVSGLGTSVADTAIVASTIALAHSVGLRAIAEGVETSQQLTMLRQMGCDFAQGYLLSHPLSAEQLVSWWQQQLPSRLVPRQTSPVRASEPENRDSAADQRDHLSDQRDNVADERDQAGDRRDVAGQHRDTAGDDRDSDADQRDRASDQRDQTSDQRDEIADHRDLLADERDAQANRRDDAASEQLRGLGYSATGDAATLEEGLEVSAAARHDAAVDRTLASQDRVVGVGDRLQAERDRGHARVDRGAGADERVQAGQDRTQAQADRHTSAQDRQTSSVDALTGAYLPDAGLVALMAAMATAVRGGEPLTLAYVAVEPQAAGQQSEGQIGADALMVVVANALGARLRETDVLVRGGQRHFHCALPGLTAAAAAARMAAVHTDLAGLVAVSVGYAELQRHETAGRLIERAKEARQRR
jgi:diguanylate cyclase (GGDEF)-like protein/PAS domain S-box-containing protein